VVVVELVLDDGGRTESVRAQRFHGLAHASVLPAVDAVQRGTQRRALAKILRPAEAAPVLTHLLIHENFAAYRERVAGFVESDHGAFAPDDSKMQLLPGEKGIRGASAEPFHRQDT